MPRFTAPLVDVVDPDVIFPEIPACASGERPRRLRGNRRSCAACRSTGLRARLRATGRHPRYRLSASSRCAAPMAESPQLFGQPIARRFKFVIGDAVGCNAPLIGLPTRNAPRAHHNVLGPRDADHLLQARGAARTRDLAETLLGKGIKAGFRDQAEIAGQRQFEADAEAIAAAGSNDRLTAARPRSDVPGEARG